MPAPPPSSDPSGSVRSARLPVRQRLLVLAVLGTVGGAAFLPFLAAGSGKPVGELLAFPLGVAVISTIAAWLGLRAADAAGLPMPVLRRLDGGPPTPIAPRALITTGASCVLLGIVGMLTLRVIGAPALPGSAATRALSTLFAAGPLEIVLHLFAMSVVVWLSRRRWIGIVAAAAALVAFHVSGGAQSPELLAVIVVGNGLIGLVLGALYAAYGLEFAMLGHAIAHLITVLSG